MSKEQIQPVDSVLYLVEGSESKAKTEAELKKPDPDNMQAVFAKLVEGSKDVKEEK